MTQKISFGELKALSLVIFIASVAAIATDIYLPSLTAIMAALHTNQSHVQQTISIFYLGLSASMIFYGPISDKVGRKKPILFAALIASLGAYLSAQSTTIFFLLLTRLLQGIGAGGCIALARTISADTLQGQRLAISGSYISLVISLSMMTAPTLGAYIDHHLGWQMNFYLLSILFGIAFILFFFFFEETDQHKTTDLLLKEAFSSYSYLIKNKVFYMNTTIAGVIAMANIAFITSSAFIFQHDFHWSVIEYGWAVSATATGMVLGKIAAPPVIRKIGMLSSMSLGMTLVFISGFILLLLQALSLSSANRLIICVFITTIGFGLTGSNALSLALSPFHKERGAAGSLFSSLQMLMGFFASAMVAVFASGGVYTLATAYMISAIIGLMCIPDIKPCSS